MLNLPLLTYSNTNPQQGADVSSDEEAEINNFARKRSKNIDSDVSLDVSSKCFMIIYNLFCVYIYRRVMRILLFSLPNHLKK